MKNKLHILFINSWYPSKVMPNSGDFIQRHAEAVATKHQVTAIHVISDKNVKKTTIDDSYINGVRTIIAYPQFTKNSILRLIRFFKAYMQILKRIDYFDTIHLNRIYPAGLIALYLKWFQKKTYIISEHWHGYHMPFSKTISYGEQFWSKKIVKNASSICPVSDHLGKAMQNYGLNNSQYQTIPNVVDTTLFKPITNKNKTYTIVHVSSMDKVKNIPQILEVIRDLSHREMDFKFYLIGNNANDFKKLSEELKIPSNQIYFINQLPQEELVSYLQKADVLVLFSTIENLPCVILEAFACGVPVISTNVGGIHEHFPNGFGTLIPKNDKNALLTALIEQQKELKRNSKENMHTYINRNFSKKIIARAFTRVYLSSLKK